MPLLNLKIKTMKIIRHFFNLMKSYISRLISLNYPISNHINSTTLKSVSRITREGAKPFIQIRSFSSTPKSLNNEINENTTDIENND